MEQMRPHIPLSDSETNRPLISLDGITVRVRTRFMFHGTSLIIRAGEHWVVLGPNGAGKTSFARALAGEIPIVGGKITRHYTTNGFNGVGYVSFDQHEFLITRESEKDEARSFSGNFDDVLTVRDFLDSVPSDCQLRIPGINGNRLPEIAHLMDRPVRHLSVGEMRRVLIVRAVQKSPVLLILDEPFEGLDEASMAGLSAMLDRLAMNPHMAMILVTHRLDRIPDWFSHMLCLTDGSVAFAGPIADKGLTWAAAWLYASGSFVPDRSEPGQHALQTIPDSSPSLPFGSKPDPASGPLIVMKNVSVRHGHTTVLHGVNWTVNPGQHWAVLGPNGSGKTTLLSLICGDHPQVYANHIRIFGIQRGTGESVWEIKHHIGMVSSEFQMGYQKQISAFEVVLSGFFDSIGLYRHSSQQQRAVAGDWMMALHLDHLKSTPFPHLSHGQKRLVLLARAMVKQPRLLLLDEPCQGLDLANRRMIIDAVERIGRNGYTHLVFVTHFQEEIPPCITHILRLDSKNGTAISVNKI